MVNLTIIIEKGETNYSAYCLEIPGVIATGKTEEKVIRNMKGAIVFHLVGLREEKQALPTPVSKAKKISLPKKLFDIPDGIPA